LKKQKINKNILGQSGPTADESGSSHVLKKEEKGGGSADPMGQHHYHQHQQVNIDTINEEASLQQTPKLEPAEIPIKEEPTVEEQQKKKSHSSSSSR
jgi:hypothetical protein